MRFSILVPIDDSEWSRSAMDIALWLARENRDTVRLSGLHVVNVTQIRGRWLSDIAGLLGFEPVVVPVQVEAHFVNRGQALLDAFSARCAEASVTCHTELDRGGVIDRIIHHGDLHDLVVMGVRGETEEQFPGHGGSTAERVLRRICTTTLVVSRGQSEISGIVLGFDGSDGSARALNAAAHLAQLAKVPMHAIHVTDGPPDPDPLDEVRARMSGSPVEFHTHRVDGEAQETLPAESERLSCDVLALGYRGRSRVRDVFLGRTTEWLVGKVALTLLIAR